MAGGGDGEVVAQGLRAEQAYILPSAAYTFAGDKFRGEMVEGIQFLPPATGEAVGSWAAIGEVVDFPCIGF